MTEDVCRAGLADSDQIGHLHELISASLRGYSESFMNANEQDFLFHV